MPGPDWLQFKHTMNTSRRDIIHSAKGSTWKDHKYVKKENGKYYYPGQTTAEVTSVTGDAKNGLHVSVHTRYEPEKNFIEKAYDKVKNKLSSLFQKGVDKIKKILGKSGDLEVRNSVTMKVNGKVINITDEGSKATNKSLNKVGNLKVTDHTTMKINGQVIELDNSKKKK